MVVGGGGGGSMFTFGHTVGSDLSDIYLSGNLIYLTEDWGRKVLHTIVYVDTFLFDIRFI